MHAFSARDSPASWCSAGAGSSSWDAGARCQNASMLGSASCPHTCATASRCLALRFGSLSESSTAAAAASRKLLNPSCFSASFSAGSPPAPPSAHTRHVPYRPSVLQGGVGWQAGACLICSITGVGISGQLASAGECCCGPQPSACAPVQVGLHRMVHCCVLQHRADGAGVVYPWGPVGPRAPSLSCGGTPLNTVTVPRRTHHRDAQRKVAVPARATA